MFLGTWKLGAILLSLSVLYGDDGIRHRVKDSEPKVIVTDADNAERMPGDLVDEVIVLDEALLADGDDSFETVDTSADDPAQIYYTSGTTGLAKGILHAHRYILAHEEFLYCHDVPRGRAVPRHGRVGLGGRHLPADRALALRRDAVRLRARGRLRPPPPARGALPPRRHQRLHDPHRDALDDGDRGRRRALPAALPRRLLGR